MSDTDTQHSEISQPKLGPGDRLQAARISIGLTLQEVANKMHLSTAILGNLEENNFSEITAPIFVKGYLRSYARIVSLDENEIIDQYVTYYMDGDPPISSTSNTTPEINADDSRIKWVTYLVILGLITLLTTWWWSRYQQPAETVSLESVESETLSAQIDSTDAMGRQVALEPTKADELSPTTADPETMEQAAAPQVEDDSIQSSAQAALAETVTMPVASSQASPSVEPSSGSVGTEAVVENGDDLVITVSADTWTDIRDASGNKLVYDLLRAGERITVNGQAPFRAFLGNGFGVKLEYQGEDIDLSRVIRSDNTARISIGQ